MARHDAETLAGRSALWLAHVAHAYAECWPEPATVAATEDEIWDLAQD